MLAVKQKQFPLPSLRNALISPPSLGYGAKQEPLILTAVTKVEEAHKPEEERWPEEFQVHTVEIRATCIRSGRKEGLSKGFLWLKELLVRNYYSDCFIYTEPTEFISASQS